MPKYVAFLRAINVGGHTVKMDQLRQIFAELGFSNVETFIASGNVIFDSPSKSSKSLEKKIEDCLHDELGYPVETFIRSTSELSNIARYQPFNEADLTGDGNVLYITFLGTTPEAIATDNLLSFSNEIERFHVNEREVYWLLRRKLGESEFTGARLEKTLGMKATARNSTTVKKIALKYP